MESFLRGLFFPMTLSDLRSRRSVRAYTSQPLEKSVVDAIKAEITMINTVEAGMRFQLILDDAAPFDGFRNSYGLLRNVRNYIACVIEPSYPDTYQRCGYCAQQLVTLAVSLGLGTCYVGGSYNADLTSAQLRAGEKIPFLIALGYEDKGKETLIAKVGKSLTHISKKRPADILTSDVSISEIQANRPLLYTGLEAMLCAPSSMNRQPVRVQYRQGEILATVGSGSNSDLIDLGIALFNFQAVYPGVWEWGNPAQFIPDNSE